MTVYITNKPKLYYVNKTWVMRMLKKWFFIEKSPIGVYIWQLSAE